MASLGRNRGIARGHRLSAISLQRKIPEHSSFLPQGEKGGEGGAEDGWLNAQSWQRA